jgi:hypothetical protein
MSCVIFFCLKVSCGRLSKRFLCSCEVPVLRFGKVTLSWTFSGSGVRTTTKAVGRKVSVEFGVYGVGR